MLLDVLTIYLTLSLIKGETMSPDFLFEPMMPLVILAGVSVIGMIAVYAYATGYDRGHARGCAVVRAAFADEFVAPLRRAAQAPFFSDRAE